ncbi:hypothetical protein R1flu_022866 [Riccia fluitans]|uniref:Peptidase M28 domain-containing protein n=1 Tax=Riccia fluitans TaxID=41844 RepID=A0ABD1XQW7_9MARC
MRRRRTEEPVPESVGGVHGDEANAEEEKKRVPEVKADYPAAPEADLAIPALLILVFFYGFFSLVAIKAMHMEFVVPLSSNAPLDTFSEGRAMEHVYRLAADITGRQEGQKGLDQAANYIKDELNRIKARASSSVTVDVDESFVDGSYNLVFLKHNVSFSYRNHTNIAVRVAAKDASEDAASLLLNAHFDGPLGSPGASDCASCVASLLETFRYVIDTNWIPPAPVIFLFNGAEELFLVAAHGFITTHKWRASVGAVINVEAAGASGPDLVVQSGPGSWPSRVYYESAVHPMANSVAQDIFPLIPGDTDYRIFSQDFGDIPGLDILFVLKGTVYHTPYDKPEAMVPGSLQARGDNLVALVKGFTNAPELKGAAARAEEKKTSAHKPAERRPVFFDIWGTFMVFYPHKVASALHVLPLAIVFLVPSITSPVVSGIQTVGARAWYILQGWMIQAVALLLGFLFPLGLAVMRLSVSNTALTWFSRPWIALCMFVPSSLAGLLLPRILWRNASSKINVGQESVEWGGHWGGVGINALLTAVITLSGGSGPLDFLWAFFLILAFPFFRLCQHIFGKNSLLAMIGYLLALTVPIAYSVNFGGVFVQFLAEKAGMTGSNPLPLGFYVSDAAMSLLVGGCMVMCVAPILPVAARWIGKPYIIRLLMYLSVGAAALSSRSFPYSYEAPKRLVLQHTFYTTGGNQITKSSYDFASVDPNPVAYIWRQSPSIAASLRLSDAQISNDIDIDPVTFTALYPVTRLLNRGTRVPLSESLNLSGKLPLLQVVKEEKFEHNEALKRRFHIELDFGDLQEIWGAAMNITGPLSNWSFADQKLPGPETVPGGPPSYICRLSGLKENWFFWVEANSNERLRIELAVLDQRLERETERLISSFPPWVAVTAGSSYLSSYEL